MPSKFKPYNKRNFIQTSDGKEALREKCVLELRTIQAEDGTPVFLSSNQVYIRDAKGALRKVHLHQKEKEEEMVKMPIPSKSIDNIS